MISERQGYDLGVILFGSPPSDFAASKAKNCSVGYPCGNTCISTSKACKVLQSGQAGSFATWIITHINQGNKLTKSQANAAKSKGYFDGLKPTIPNAK